MFNVAEALIVSASSSSDHNSSMVRLLLVAATAVAASARSPLAPAPKQRLSHRGGSAVVASSSGPASLERSALAVGGGELSATTKGYASLVGGLLCHLVLGTMYCWGNFVSYLPPELRRMDGVVAAAGDRGDGALALPLTLLAMALTIPLGTKFTTVVGAKVACLTGGYLLVVALLLASVAKSLPVFLLCYSGIFGLGLGTGYTAPMVAGWSWFPTKRGFVSGAILMGFGSGGFIFNLLGSKLINPKGLAASGGEFPAEIYASFPAMLRKLAACYFALTTVGALMVSQPAAPPKAAAKAAPTKSVVDMVANADFALLYLATMLCASAGLTSAGVYKVFASSVDSMAGAGDGYYATVGAIGALANGIGRLAWGSVVDKLGYKTPYLAMLVIQAAVTALIPVTATAGTGPFLVAIALSFFCLGGMFSMVPSAVGILFGTADAAQIYSYLFSAFAVASLAGVKLAKALIPKLGWTAVYQTLAACTLASAGITLALDV